MSSFGPTFYADCEIIINAFERGAAYSSDPKSVYAMTTPVLSRMRSDAQNIDKQFEKQSVFKGLMDEELDTQNAGTSLRTKGGKKDKEEDEGSTPTPPERDQEKRWVDKTYGSKGKRNEAQKFMHNCIPCEARIRSAEKFHNDFWEGGGFEDQYTNMIAGLLEGAAQKLKNILDMFRNQGMKDLQNICDTFDALPGYQCPTDIAIIIKGLSTLLVKFSMDLLGDINIMMGLIASLIGPLISSVIQLIKNWIQVILDPINCLVDNFYIQLKALSDISEATGELIQDTVKATEGFGVQAGSVFKDREPMFQSEDKDIQVSTINPLTGKNVSFGKVTVPGGNFKRPKKNYWDPMVVGPIYSGDITYKAYLDLENKKRELEKVIDRQAYILENTNSDDTGSLSQNYINFKKTDDELEAVTTEMKKSWYRRSQKAYNNALDSTKDFYTDSRDMLLTVIDYLTELTQWMEDFFRKWLEEFGRLVGDSFTIDIGFLEKQERKLTLLQMIALFSSYFEFLKAGKDRCNEDDLQKILTRAFHYSDKIAVKTKNGKIKLVDEKAGDVMISSPGIDLIKSWKGLSLKPTEDPDFDAMVASVGDSFTSPTEAIFSCNKNISSKENAEQLQNWMEELQE